jgi:hypothetical protein
LRKAAKERDEWRRRADNRAYRKASGLLKRETFNTIVKALHPDTRADNIEEACRLFLTLKPLFDEE